MTTQQESSFGTGPADNRPTFSAVMLRGKSESSIIRYQQSLRDKRRIESHGEWREANQENLDMVVMEWLETFLEIIQYLRADFLYTWLNSALEFIPILDLAKS